jgi:hypothetical protein
MVENIEKSLLEVDFASLTRMTLPAAGFAIYQAAPGLNRLGPSPPPDLKPWQPRK